MRRTIPLGPAVPRRGNWLSCFLGWLVLLIMRWRVVGDMPNVPKAVVVVAPHTSNWDGVVALASIWGLRLRIAFMIKAEATRGPGGLLVRWLDGIGVDRSSAADVVPQTVAAFQSRDKLWLGLAPEGTRKSPESWKSGFYRMAVAAGVPLVMVGLDYGRRQTRILGLFQPTGDFEADLPQILAFYAGIQPGRPDRLSKPLRELNDR